MKIVLIVMLLLLGLALIWAYRQLIGGLSGRGVYDYEDNEE